MSEGGWETVRQYDANLLAEDSDNENRLRRAEARAVRKKFKKTTKRTRQPYSYMSDHSGFAVLWNIPMASTSTSGSHFPMAARQDYSFRGFGNPAFGGTAAQGPLSGVIYWQYNTSSKICKIRKVKVPELF